MADKQMIQLTKGPRAVMAALERWIVQRDAGPMNNENWNPAPGSIDPFDEDGVGGGGGSGGDYED
ncbi:hypothetical protein [Jatrophihabitans sp. GAS493]|uniref:hypothetical protein n=1 Tax=Jatrophihabitans sp. GAS493 TaxID=1907575 RepID=UPI0012FD2DA5|nr:hypothetical protein [Jatrophihabitans sp. GAS493]